MTVVICPGIHDPKLTDDFIKALFINSSSNFLLIPTQDYAPYSAIDILRFLWYEKSVNIDIPLLFIAFSAGVVGTVGAAWSWQLVGGQVKALIVIDGWGIPVTGNFPIYKVSHDYFTHWSCEFFSRGDESFYAYPSVKHLEIWRSPDKTTGWWLHKNSVEVETASPATAREFLREILTKYGEFTTDNDC